MKFSKIALIGNASSVHLVKIANYLVRVGYSVTIFSVHERGGELDVRVGYKRLPGSPPFGYLSAAPSLYWALKNFQPDIINTHYASGYGLLSSFTPIAAPTLTSVWGSDVYDFPKKNIFFKFVLKWILLRSDAIASTSRCMTREVRKYAKNRHIAYTPFGINEAQFSYKSLSLGGRREVTFGTVKSLHHNYGIDILIRAFSEMLRIHPDTRSTRLLIVGSGESKRLLMELTHQLGVADKVLFRDAIPHSAVPAALREMDIYVALSRNESFGVAVLEAAACGRAIIVSDAPGLAEVMVHGKTALIVPRESITRAADAMYGFFADPQLRKKMGRAAATHVSLNFAEDVCFRYLVEAYVTTIALSIKS